MKRDFLIVTAAVAFLLYGLDQCYASSEHLYTTVNPKVVMLHMINGKHSGVCSGAFIDEDGTVFTCAHCFAEIPNKLFVKTSDGTAYQSAIIDLDPKRDLARVWTGAAGRGYFQIGPKVKIGQEVYAFGSPLGIKDTMSKGMVENVVTEGKRIIIHSSFVNPGNSGGPLVNEHGQLVGVNEAILMINFLMPAQGLFLAIDSSEVRDFLEGR